MSMVEGSASALGASTGGREREVQEYGVRIPSGRGARGWGGDDDREGSHGQMMPRQKLVRFEKRMESAWER